MSLDITYFSGGPRERVLEAILNSGHRVRHVFVNDPERWPKIKPTIALARQAEIPVTIISRKDQIADALDVASGRLCLSAGFAYLFPKYFLDAVSACLNVHGSLLPKYGGARTLSWAIENGESESGVTVHSVDEGMDTGPILLQRSFALSPFETTRSLGRKTGAFEPQVVVEALALWESRGKNALVAQPPAPARLPNRIPQHSQIDPSLPLSQLFNAIRAADPDHYPAHFFVENQKVCIRLWRPEKPDSESDLI